MGITTNTLNESLGLIDPLKQFRINEALKRAQTEQEKNEIEKEIDEVDAKIDYADDHGMSKDHLIDEIDALNEEVESYIYLFPELTYEDKEQLRDYNLSIVGRNRFEDEVNTAVKGSKSDLERYAAEYLDYQLHPDYLYVEDDFAGEVEPDIFEEFDMNGDVDFSIDEIEVSEPEEDIVEPGEIIDDPFLPDEFEYDDDISDFGPGNPWDAPGMSVKDFLR